MKDGVEKTGNLITDGYFTTDGKVKYCIAIDKYEDKMENGGPLSDNEKMVYYGAKAWVGDELDTSQESEYTQSFGNVLHDNILDTYKNNDAKSVNTDIRLLSSLDSDLAGDVNGTLAGVRAEERYRLQLETNSSLRGAERGLYDDTGRIYKEQNTLKVGVGYNDTYTIATGGSAYVLSAGKEWNGTVMAHIGVEIDKSNLLNTTITVTGAAWQATTDKTGSGNYHKDDNTQYGAGVSLVYADKSSGITFEPNAYNAISNISGKSSSVNIDTPLGVGVTVSKSDAGESGYSWRNIGVGLGAGATITYGRPSTEFDVEKVQKDNTIQGKVNLKEIVNSLTLD